MRCRSCGEELWPWDSDQLCASVLSEKCAHLFRAHLVRVGLLESISTNGAYRPLPVSDAVTVAFDEWLEGRP